MDWRRGGKILWTDFKLSMNQPPSMMALATGLTKKHVETTVYISDYFWCGDRLADGK